MFHGWPCLYRDHSNADKSPPSLFIKRVIFRCGGGDRQLRYKHIQEVLRVAIQGATKVYIPYTFHFGLRLYIYYFSD